VCPAFTERDVQGIKAVVRKIEKEALGFGYNVLGMIVVATFEVSCGVCRG